MNPTPTRSTCASALRALALQDDATADVAAARRHVDRCPLCSALVLDEGSAERALAALAAHRPAPGGRLRRAITVASVAQLVLALPWLFAWNPFAPIAGHASASHLARDGALGVFVGVAGVLASALPRHATAMLLTVIAAVLMQALGFAVDEPANNVSLAYEALHLLVPVIIAGIGALALRRDPAIAEPHRPTRLRVVR